MNGQVQFGGNVPFTDHNTGQPVQVRVWGVYVGQGVDPHEEQAIQQWIMNALATSAASYQGNVYELQGKAQEWGQWVSQQIAPGLAQAFQAQGQIHIQGVSLEGAGNPMGGAPMGGGMGMGAAAMGGAAMGMAGGQMAGGQMGGAQMGAAQMGGDKLQVAASALSQRMGIPHQQALQAAQIVLEAISGGAMAGGAAMAGHDPYAKKAADPYAQKKQPDPYAKKAADPYKQPDPYAKKAADPYKQQPDPYAKKAADPYKNQPVKQNAPAYKADKKQNAPAYTPDKKQNAPAYKAPTPAKADPSKKKDQWKK